MVLALREFAISFGDNVDQGSKRREEHRHDGKADGDFFESGDDLEFLDLFAFFVLCAEEVLEEKMPKESAKKTADNPDDEGFDD